MNSYELEINSCNSMLHLGKMQVEAALFFETVEQIYARVFRVVRPHAPLPEISVRYKQYANANSRISLQDGRLLVEISDLLESAPAPIQEALASVLLAKLFGRTPDKSCMAQYRHYLNRADMRRSLHSVKRERGRKAYGEPRGAVYDLTQLFSSLNHQYFHGLIAAPALGWSLRSSRTILGHYDPSHHVIVLSRSLDSADAPESAVRFVMFHEMLHLRYPTENHGARRCVHTKEFKRAEKQFANYDVAKEALKQFVRRQT
jgi:hypothetical protein